MTDNDQDLVVVRAIYAETPQAVEIELPRETSIEDARKLAFNELQKVLHGIQKYVSINLDDDHTELQLVGKHLDPLRVACSFPSRYLILFRPPYR